MTLYFLLKWVHVLSAAVLFGTGLGIAFFMLAAWRTRDIAVLAGVARIVVLADFIFTATAIVLQPLSGAALIAVTGADWRAPWLMWSYALYAIAGAFWLPVVWIQLRIAREAEAARAAGAAISEQGRRLLWIWFWCGWPAFVAVLAIYALMIARPA